MDRAVQMDKGPPPTLQMDRAVSKLTSSALRVGGPPTLQRRSPNEMDRPVSNGQGWGLMDRGGLPNGQGGFQIDRAPQTLQMDRAVS